MKSNAHRRLKLQSGDIYLKKPINFKIVEHRPKRKSVDSDPFLSYKESYQLPINDSKQRYNTINLTRRLRSLQSRPIRLRLKSNVRSKTIVADVLGEQLIKKQISTFDIGTLQDKIKNKLDYKYLTQFQKIQIKTYKNVYYIGHKAYLRKNKDKFEDKNDNYKPIIGDHIAYRFQIISIIGSGAFGKVLEVLDHKSNKSYALKILKISQQLSEQFELEIKILKIARDHHTANKTIVEIKGDFEFRSHKCIVTELLGSNLYSYIKQQNFHGLQLDLVRKILIQIMQALLFLHQRNIIHCDIKPQNIVFKHNGNSGVSLIDFGSACFYDRKQFTYIQSRYYRSPQIVLMKPYDHKIDVWSLGCLAYELFIGMPLFPSRSQIQQINMIKAVLGNPPQSFLNKCQRAQHFDFYHLPSKSDIIGLRERMSHSVPQSYIDFLQKTVQWSPEDRPTIKELLVHQFILDGLPRRVRKEHLSHMRSSNPYNLF